MKLTFSLLMLALSGFAAQQTFSGQISDSMCGASHAGMGDMGKNPKECTAGCVKSGARYVFVANGKVFEIANQGFGDIARHAGETVQLTGDIGSDGKRITVSKLEVKK